MSNTDDKPAKGGKKGASRPFWTSKAALTGAAIGSAALAAALLYASRRKERAEKAAAKAKASDVPETD